MDIGATVTEAGKIAQASPLQRPESTTTFQSTDLEGGQHKEQRISVDIRGNTAESWTRSLTS